jgi:hypothetical protein
MEYQYEEHFSRMSPEVQSWLQSKWAGKFIERPIIKTATNTLYIGLLHQTDSFGALGTK